MMMQSHAATAASTSASSASTSSAVAAAAATTTTTITNGLSLSHEESDSPERVQELKHDSSVLALAVSDKYIFAGTHNGELLVWSLATFELVRRIQAHKRHVLWLFLSDSPSSTSHSDSTSSAPDSVEADSRSLLISSAGDALVSVWCPTTFTRLYEIYSLDHVGDVFSCAYSRQQDTVYLGAQDQSIQWVRLGDPERRVPHNNPNHPNRRQDRFFDSKAVGGTSTPRRKDRREDLIPDPDVTLEIHRGSVGKYAHFGFVYCMIIAKGPTVLVDPDEEVLISGGGDGTIKLWQIRQDEKYEGLEEWEAWEKREIMCLGEEDGVAESVFSLAIDGSFLYSGKKKGIVELWDLDTKQKLRVIKGHRGDVMALQLSWGYLLSGATTGSAAKHSTVHFSKDHQPLSPSSEKVSQRYQCLRRWKAHDGKVLSSACTTYNGDKLYITGANDNAVSVWRIDEECQPDEETAEKSEDMMFSSLREFVSYKTISSRPEFVEDCRRGASFLCNLFKRLGARVHMLSMDDQTHNPVVCAVFSGKLEPAEARKRILFYGHYDVVPADRNTDSKWLTDPFQVEGINGYWYGRGVSDNKGPIMAALFAVADLLQAKQLESDVIFLIDGEEESGSRGFQETVQRNKDLIGKVDYILLANSYWLDNETPCLTYGLRGVLHATVCVDSVYPDLHSGVDGSYMVDEPLSDLTRLLSTLKGPGNQIMVPHFYDSVLPLTTAEEARYEDITQILSRRSADAGTVDQLKQSLMARWREPNLTIHRYKVSGLDGSVVSGHASATISLRLVPGQEVDDIIASLGSFLDEQFKALESRNRMSIKIDNKAEPWLGDPTNEIFKTLEEAIIKVWGLNGDTAGGEDGAVEQQSRSRENGYQVQANEGVDNLEDTGADENTLPTPRRSLRDSSSTFGPAPSASPTSSHKVNPGPSSATSSPQIRRQADSTHESRAQTQPAEEQPQQAEPPQPVVKGRKPLYIREGGSIPAIRFLEKEFGASAAHLPCGQASDAAHLENERIRMVNLIKSRSIFGEVFRRL
ncbi:putative di- and tripeptidase DUG2 [Cytospora mali]|uniref:Di-and tripeptidase DUG2 n=1 Tax=Cytospora mali TaxID=578113 RepID=A0A194W0F3_CYTMA|nr:putative di- and tripeptidase DUG2 [Valsa mali]